MWHDNVCGFASENVGEGAGDHSRLPIYMEIDRYADSQPGSICKTVFLVDLHLHICRPPFLGQPFNVIYLALHFNLSLIHI